MANMNNPKDRAIYILTVAANYIEAHCPDELIHYDGAKCDGSCLAEDCRNAANELLLDKLT